MGDPRWKGIYIYRMLSKSFLCMEARVIYPLNSSGYPLDTERLGQLTTNRIPEDKSIMREELSETIPLLLLFISNKRFVRLY
jgi:hypothetical protein